MTNRRIRDVIVGVILAVLVWAFYRANSKKPSDVNAVDRIILTVSAPLERAFVAVYAAWMDVWHQYRFRVDIKKENERLARENLALEANNRYLAAIAARGRRLQRFRAYMEDSAAEMLPANVVRRRIDTARFRVVGIVIDRRYPDVACGAPVVTPRGVVGRVLYFELPDGDTIGCPVKEQLKRPRYRRKFKGKRPRLGRALVQLSVDPGSRIDVRIDRTGARGMLRGLGWNQGFVARLADLGPKAVVKKGDLVITTGVDGRFPAGLPVGRILSVTEQTGEERRVLVKPVMDFGKLTRVLVVISPPPPAVPRPRRPGGGRLGLGPYP